MPDVVALDHTGRRKKKKKKGMKHLPFHMGGQASRDGLPAAPMGGQVPTMPKESE
jgi:hypothetical protein